MPATPVEPSTIGPITITVHASTEFLAMLDRLAIGLGHTPGEILSKALILYEIAADAVAEGKRVVIMDADMEEIDREITGFGKETP